MEALKKLRLLSLEFPMVVKVNDPVKRGAVVYDEAVAEG